MALGPLASPAPVSAEKHQVPSELFKKAQTRDLSLATEITKSSNTNSQGELGPWKDS